ncbi:MAG: hypothetical protein AAF351_15065, partial [Pseudomonadota bacterium]
MRNLKRLVFVVLALAANAAAAETEFARVFEDSRGQPIALQVAIVSYVDPNDLDVRVDLIGAIHIGDADYYHDLNRRFEDYDALLYELVAPEGTVIEPGPRDHQGIISNTQSMMRTALDLAYQLEEIDYTADNFVHADLSPTQFSESMDERGESLYVYFWRMFYASMGQYARDPLGLQDTTTLASAMASGNDSPMKVMLAYQMADPATLKDMLGKDADNAVIGARNQRAIDVLKEQLDAADGYYGIFYGVAHMPDFEDRLIDQLGLEYDGT